MKKIVFAVLLYLAFIPCGGAETLDASDRLYFQRLEQILVTSQKTIDIAMDQFSFKNEPDDPVKKIIDLLIMAQKKAVRVRLFLNTYAESRQEAGLFLREDILYQLRREGIEIHFVSPKQYLHDRLVISDGRYVLEGGIPWSREHLEKGLGAAVLLDSPEIAEKKRIRLEFLPLWDVSEKESELSEGSVAVPFYLLHDAKLFPAMVNNQDGDAFKIALALLRKFYQVQDIRFPVTYEELTREIPADLYFERSAVSAQVIQSLERLASEYRLIEIQSKESDRMKIRLLLPDQLEPFIRVPVSFFQENYAKELSQEGLFAYFLITYKTQITGESPVWLGSGWNVEQDFPIGRDKFMTGIKELREKNLIEVFPFKFQDGYKTSEDFEYRYLLNPVAGLSDKLEMWSRLRDQFSDDDFRTAQDMARLLGEPEDPKVLAVYLDLLKVFRKEDILAFTERVAGLAPRSTPEMLEYLRTLLEHESQKNVHLLTV